MTKAEETVLRVEAFLDRQINKWRQASDEEKYGPVTYADLIWELEVVKKVLLDE